jgi:hypothetical protein
MQTSGVALYLVQLFASLFLAILFVQSGVDKIVDRPGNLEWLKGHFAKSPLAGMVPLLLTVITILETAAGVLSAILRLRFTAQPYLPRRSPRSFSVNGWPRNTPARRFSSRISF